MERRTHEGPMDFEYQNGTGPMDGRSPFAQISMNSQRNLNNDKKRSWTSFDKSPTKPAYPSLRQPAPNQPYLFSDAPKPLPALPLNKNPLFNTPRKLDVTNDIDSSGGETPKSPEHRDLDSDATPDTMSLRSRFAILDTTSRPEFKAGGAGKPTPSTTTTTTLSSSPGKEDIHRRQSWWRSTVSRMSPLSRGTEYSHAAERKIMKKRSRQQQALARRISISDDSGGEDTPEKRMAKSSRKANKLRRRGNGADQQGDGTADDAGDDRPHWMYTFFQFLTNHPTLPHILSFYAQLLLNLFLIVGIMYILYSFWSTIRSDVDKKSSEAVAELLAEMAVCAQQYTANRCDRATRVPAMEVVCTNWEKCMSQDPKNVGRARVSAHTFAEIFNGFIEPISYKAMIFSLILVFGSIGISNFAFSIFRDKAAAAAQANAQHHHYYANNMPPPPTPQRQFSGADGGYWTPYHQQQQGLEPGPSASFPNRQIESPQKSPVRKLQFR